MFYRIEAKLSEHSEHPVFPRKYQGPRHEHLDDSVQFVPGWLSAGEVLEETWFMGSYSYLRTDASTPQVPPTKVADLSSLRDSR